jgi:hypothetical protein
MVLPADNEHRAQGPATVGFRTVRFFGALLVNYGKISLSNIFRNADF